MKKKVLIVGGVAGGASAAARLRRLDESIEIIMFERGGYISFANCGLPYYIGGSIKERSALLVQTPEAMRSRFNIDVRIQSEVLSIDRENKTVEVFDKIKDVTYKESYDVLVLSPGSSPIKPKIAGIDSPNIFTLWNIPDTDAIKNFIDTHKVRRAAVIGGGFIGVEMVENLHALGMEVTLIEMADQVLAPVDFEMAQILHNHMSSQGVRMHLKNGVKSFHYNAGVTTVVLQDETKVDAELVILAIGVTPNGQLAKSSGLETNPRGGIVVNDRLLTNDPSIYALGDAIEVVDYVQGTKAMVPLAGPANKQGRIVANNIVGRDEAYEGTQGTFVAKVFDMTVASTGVNEKTLIQKGQVYGKDYFLTIVQPNDHAGYYPGAMPMTLKVLFDGSGRVLGAQNVGYEGVEKRIDVIAAAMRFATTVYDFKRLELSYAPPYSSAKDPVNMAGFAAENILNGDQPVVLWREVDSLDPAAYLIVDVREPIERELGGLKNSIHIPLNDLRTRMGELPKDKTIVVYCAVGLRGYIAARQLQQNGFTVKNLIGGYKLYDVFHKSYVNPVCEVDQTMAHVTDNGVPEKVEKAIPMPQDLTSAIEVNACGLQCPGPILQVHQRIAQLSHGDILKVSATDPGFVVDVQAWCKKTGNTFIKSDKDGRVYTAYLQKGTPTEQVPVLQNTSGSDASTMVVFSGDLDKALAAMIIANGAAAMGRHVTLFFTFWGLNILRKHEKVAVKKSFMDTMFGMMMPRGYDRLKLSKLNMGGMGTMMMRMTMKNKHVNTLEELIASAMDNGVRFVACTMSMDVMGITKEELMDGVEYGGVAAYLGAADDANHNLFI